MDIRTEAAVCDDAFTPLLRLGDLDMEVLMTDPRDIQIEGLRALLAETKAERDTALHNCSRWRAEAHSEREARIKLEYEIKQLKGEAEHEEDGD